MKRLISITLSVIIALTALLSLPFVSNASVVSGSCGDNGNNVTWSYNTDTGVLTLSGSGSTANYNDDASLAPWINDYATQIKRVVVENGVTGIGSKAFMNCTAMESVDLGSVQYIGWYAFRGCTALGGVAIPNSVLQTWSGCFENCTSIGWINIGSGLTSLCPWMFAGCNSSNFWWVHIPANITNIEEHAFDGCSSLGWNTIAGTGITFGQDCFKNTNKEGTFLIADAATREYLQSYAEAMNTPEYDSNGNQIEKAEYKWKYDCMDGNHSYTGTVTEPTCTEQGYTTYHCSICNNDNVSDYVEELGHDYVLQGASSTDYYFNYKCSRCNEVDSVSALTLKDWLYSYINDTQSQLRYKRQFDLNGDGIINTRDYSLILNQYNLLNSSAHQTTVDTATTHQTMYGFGASACWWSQFIGGWSDEKVNEVMGMLYDDENGIGLNVYRYNLGAGSKDDSALYTISNRTECFLQSDGTYDWTADANAQKCLEVANGYCDNMRVTLFSNSPPVYYTKTGRGYGAWIADGTAFADIPCNIDSSHYADHANFVVTCGEHFTNLGYRVVDISPINEPEWAWGAYNEELTSAGQEGCHYSPAECREMYKQCIYKIRSSTINSTCEISMFESGEMAKNNYNDWSNFKNYVDTTLGSSGGSTNLLLRTYFKNICFHSYWSDQSNREETARYLNESYSSYGRLLTEYCQMDGSSSGLGIVYGLDLADTIWQDLTILDAKEWDWWVAVGGGGYMDGLLYINDYSNPNCTQEVVTSKRFWVLGNFSKFTTEGSVRIDVSTNQDLKVCGFSNPDGSITLVYINNTNNDEATYVGGTGLSTFSAYTTDATRDLEQIQANESVSAPAIIPANSVTTVVLN